MSDVVNAFPSRIQLTGINGQAQYSFNFTIYDPTALEVWAVPEGEVGNEIEDLLIYLVEYSVTITGTTGGYITLFTPSLGGEIYTLQSNAYGARASNFGNNYSFTADNVNQEFNNMVLLYKQVDTMQKENGLRYDYSQYIPGTKQLFPDLLPGYIPVGSSDGNYISQIPGPSEDSSAAQLRADLAAPSGDTLVGTNTGYSTVHNNLIALNTRAPRYGIDTSILINQIQVSYTPAPTSYATGELLEILVAQANTNSSVVLNKNGIGNIPIVRADGEALQVGDITPSIQLFIYDGTHFRLLNSSASQSSYPPMWINGLYTRNNELDVLHDIDFLTGSCRDFENNINIFLSSAITKSVDNVWAEGTGQGGFPSSQTLSPGDTVHRFIVAKEDGTVDAGFDKLIDCSALLADADGDGYIYYRRVGSGIIDDDSNWVPTNNTGDMINILADYTDFTTVVIDNTTTPSLLTVKCPTGLEIILNIFVSTVANDGQDISGSVFNANYLSAPTIDGDSGFTLSRHDNGQFKYESCALVGTNTLGQVGFLSTSNSSESYVSVLGWLDKRDII